MSEKQIKALPQQDAARNRSALTTKIHKLNAFACNNIKRDDFNVDDEMKISRNHLEALSPTQGLQEMLAAQMLSIHRLQQVSMAMANGSDRIENQQYFTNAAVKLANCFTQQANLFARLQGQGGQKITIERVDVHNGGQAVVGSTIGVPPTHGSKK